MRLWGSVSYQKHQMESILNAVVNISYADIELFFIDTYWNIPKCTPTWKVLMEAIKYVILYILSKHCWTSDEYSD